MDRIQSLLVTSAVVVGLVGLVSCSQPTPPEVAVSPTTSPSTAAPKPSAAAEPTSAGFASLNTVVSKTRTAVTAGDFEQGKTEFGKFEDSWKTVEDGVRAKAGGTYYGAIEKAAGTVNTGLKGKDAAATLAGLKTLNENLATAAKP
jgi:hypothetical protein